MGDGFSFKHHREEAHRVRRRFFLAASFLGTLLVLLGGNVWQVTRTQAANLVASGRVTVNGVGVGGVSIYTCYNNVTVRTDAGGNWSISVPKDSGFCARVTGGTGIWTGPQTNNNPEAGGSNQKTYEFQIAGRPCYNNASLCHGPQVQHDRNIDSGYDFRYANAAPVGQTNSADCVRTAGYAFDPDNSGASIYVHMYVDGRFASQILANVNRPDVRTAHGISGNHGYDWAMPANVRSGGTHVIEAFAINTASPGSNTPLGRRSVSCAGVPSPAPKPAAPAPQPAPVEASPAPAQPDKTPPSVPEAFTAAVAAGSAIVDLSWSASSDPSGIKGYKLERSVDGNGWAVVKEEITETSYRDDSAGYAVRYFYRLSALDSAGNASGFATAEVTTNAFSGNMTEGELSIQSEDKLAEATLPGGAIEGEADCLLEKSDIKPKADRVRPLILGPYELVCKTSSGDRVTEFEKPVIYTFNIKEALKGHRSPEGVSYLGASPHKQEGAYDKRQSLIAFQLVSARPVGVRAVPVQPIAFGVVVAILVFILAVVGLFVWALRRRQKQSYDEYLRKKYYDL